MAKPIPSRRQNAKRRKASSSKGVHSGNSARKKSKKSKGASGKLRVRTPKDSQLKFLRDAGIVTPEEIPADEDNVPLDFTRESSQNVGALQSRYAVRHSHAIFNAAKIAAEAAHLKREARLARAKFRLRHKGEKVNVVQAMMEDDDTITEIEDKLVELEVKVDLLVAVAQGYADLRDAASREITRRKDERAAID